MNDLYPPRGRLRSADWLRIELTIAAVFYGLFGITIAFAPESQVVTTGALPVFTVAPDLFDIAQTRAIWAVAFVVAGSALAVLLWRQTFLAQIVAWMLAIPIGCIWLGVFVLAVVSGVGSALGVVVWLVLLAWLATIAVRVGLNTTGA